VSDEELIPAADPEERLPFDLRTMLVSIVRQRRFIAGAILVSALVALAVALWLGAPVYQAQSVLLYHPDTEGRNNDPALSVQTQSNMVLLDTNLEETRRKLDIPVTLKQLESACTVRTQPNTALLMIDVLWKEPDVAARIANTLRDVYRANQQKVRQSSAALEVTDLGSRIDQLRGRLKAIDAKLDEFTASSQLVDLDKETQNYLSELTSAELAYDQAKAEKQSIDSQLQNAQRILNQTLQRPAAGKLPSTGDVNSSYSRLLNTIHEDQTVRANQEKLALDKIQMDRARQLYDEGLIPKAEYDKAALAYSAQREVSNDTEQVKKWRDEMAQLDQAMGSSDQVAGNMMQKLFQLQLDQIAAEERVKTYGQSVDRLQKRINGLPQLQRNYLTFSREAESNAAELKMLEEKLGRAEREQAAKSSEFVVVADATPPAFPAKSYRRLIFLGISVFGTLLGLGAVLARELLNRTIRSAGEATLKLPVPLLGTVPALAAAGDKQTCEPFRAAALRVRRSAPRKGARILFTSARRGEGVSTVVEHVAECLRQDHRDALVKSARNGGAFGDSDSEAYDIVLLDGPPMLESLDSEVAAPTCDATIIVVAGGATEERDVTEAISRIRNTGAAIGGVILNRVDPVYL